jgi:hypothetical protein
MRTVTGGRPARGGQQTPSAGGRTAQAWITALSLLTSALALAAAATGVFTANGQHHRSFVTLGGQTVLIQGAGLYAHESVSGAAQQIGSDIVTMLVGVPLLLLGTYLASRGSLRGQLLRAGALAYIFYTYLLLAFGGAYNQVFLVYVTLYAASLFALVLAVITIDADALRQHLSPGFARRTVAWMLVGFGLLLALMWFGRILPYIPSGATPPSLESYSTLFVQAGDLGLIVPVAVLTGVLLLRSRPFAYVLAGVVLVKATTLGLALVAMMASMAVSGVAVSPMEVAFFGIAPVVFGAATIHLLLSVPGRKASAGGKRAWSTA